MRALPLLLLLLLAACRDKELPDTGPDDSSVPTPLDEDGDGFDTETDCDDADPAVYPDAAELCDGLDNDCDGEADEGLDGVWYSDADGDGYGDDTTALTTCVPAAGAVTLGGDCDDADPAYNPGAAEGDCADPNDYNCDGSVGYADADADGFAACEECDDGDAAIHPDAAEVCDSVDNNCDGAVDEGVLLTWYADGDGDQFGDPDYPAQACAEPEGYTADASDCDDADAAVNPLATELCDGVDNDCDALVDEDDAADAATWYTDADADGYGDADAPLLACTLPSGASDDDTDCDDTDPTVYPGADEDGGTGSQAGDGLDNDCDGLEDEGLLFGSGADGAAALTADASFTDLGGACTAVSALGADSATVADASAFAAGDKALLLNLQGSSSSTAALGAWELLDVTAVSGSTVSFLTPLTATYGVGGNTDLSGQDVALFRVPQLSSLSVASGATVSAEPWDGSCGGVLALLVSGVARVDGALSAAAAGYAGGAQNTSYQSTGQQGEGTTGTGSKSYLANGSGGGGGGLSTSSCTNCEGTGGGGGHASAGTDGEQSNPALGYGGVGGASTGDASLLALTLGSGGGAGALDMSSEGGIGGAGGAGGGLLLVFASTLTVSGSLSAAGEDGEVGCAENSNWCGTASKGPSEAEPGGGGAGGSLLVKSTTLTLGTEVLLAPGGAGQLSGSSWAKTSGDGAAGRVRVDFTQLNGYAQGTADADTALTGACEPDPGASAGL